MSVKYYLVDEPCYRCGKPTRWGCHQCHKAICAGCAYKTGKTIASTTITAQGPEQYQHAQEVCITCHKEILGRAPLVLWAGSSSEVKLCLLPRTIPGTHFPADGSHVWTSSSSAENCLTFANPVAFAQYLDAFRVVQLIDFLQANDLDLRSLASMASTVMLPLQRALTQRALNANSGLYHSRHDEG